MTAHAVLIADAVTKAINDESWPITFRAERSYADFDEQLHELGAVRVDVVPVTDPITYLQSRDGINWDLSIDVGVRKRFDQDEIDQASGKIILSAIDQLTSLLESLATLLVAQRIDSLLPAGTWWRSTDIRQLYTRDHLRQWSQFTGFVRITITTESQIGA
jgi:hypothetical protein